MALQNPALSVVSIAGKSSLRFGGLIYCHDQQDHQQDREYYDLIISLHIMIPLYPVARAAGQFRFFLLFFIIAHPSHRRNILFRNVQNRGSLFILPRPSIN